MSYGSNEAVQEAEDRYREEQGNFIAEKAAELVAAGDMSREEAIEKVAEWLRVENEAEGDVTGVIGIENEFPKPSKTMPRNQVLAIASELMDAAQDASGDL